MHGGLQLGHLAEGGVALENGTEGDVVMRGHGLVVVVLDAGGGGVEVGGGGREEGAAGVELLEEHGSNYEPEGHFGVLNGVHELLR